ncbi:MAG: right-handed parallel beta-helix repeat-containing protein [Pirellulaceae bacterium]
MRAIGHALCTWILGSVCITKYALAVTVTLYVAPDGDDAASGTRTEPFATLVRARDEIRVLRAAGQVPEGAQVIVRAGVYELAESFQLAAMDSGSAQAPVTYAGAPGEEVRLIGGRAVSAALFGPVSDEILLARIKSEVRSQVVMADLASLGISQLPAYPTRYRGAPAVPELFFNDQRMQVAHWPNEGWANIAAIIDSGARPRDGDTTGRPGTFEYAEDAPGSWDVAAGIWLNGYWCYDWHEETIRIGAIDPTTRQITLSEPALYSIMSGNPSPRRYRALNVLEELDSPGEYYLDTVGRRLLFWPPHPIVSARCVLSITDAPCVRLEGVSHVRLQGFVIEASLADGVVVSGGTDVRVEGCTVRNARQLGINIEGGTMHRVQSCNVYDTGTGGISLAGGDRRALSPGGHEVVNCHIHHYSRLQLTYANALLISGVGNRAAHNLIHDAPHQAIGIHGNDNVFEFNIIHDICTETDDCGAYYKGRNPSCRGNIVRHNYWHDIGSPMGHGNAAVYFDDGDGGDSVLGNVFLRCGEPGAGPFGTIFSHGGHGLVADNNIFIDCKRALGSAPWNDDRWSDALKGGLDCFFPQKLLEEVDITKPPYTTRYPELVGFLDYQPGTARVSTAARNVLVCCGELSGGNWRADPVENLMVQRDPGFVDMAGSDFTLREDSEVFDRLPSFEPIPFRKMGLYVDEFRIALP